MNHYHLVVGRPDGASDFWCGTSLAEAVLALGQYLDATSVYIRPIKAPRGDRCAKRLSMPKVEQ